MRNLILALVVGMVLSFFVGRWTAPVPEDPRIQEQVDRLKREIIAQDKIITAQMNAAHKAEAKAKFYKDRADSAQLTKPKNRIDYENAVHRIDRYSPVQIDSDLFRIFGRLYQDSLFQIPSRRSEEVRKAGPSDR